MRVCVRVTVNRSRKRPCERSRAPVSFFCFWAECLRQGRWGQRAANSWNSLLEAGAAPGRPVLGCGPRVRPTSTSQHRPWAPRSRLSRPPCTHSSGGFPSLSFKICPEKWVLWMFAKDPKLEEGRWRVPDRTACHGGNVGTVALSTFFMAGSQHPGPGAGYRVGWPMTSEDGNDPQGHLESRSSQMAHLKF